MRAVTAFFYGRFSYVFAACSIPVICTIMFSDYVLSQCMNVDKHAMREEEHAMRGLYEAASMMQKAHAMREDKHAMRGLYEAASMTPKEKENDLYEADPYGDVYENVYPPIGDASDGAYIAHFHLHYVIFNFKCHNVSCTGGFY